LLALQSLAERQGEVTRREAQRAQLAQRLHEEEGTLFRRMAAEVSLQ
jgi:hypothetical protein